MVQSLYRKTAQKDAMWCALILCNIMQHTVMQCCAMQYDIVWCYLLVKNKCFTILHYFNSNSRYVLQLSLIDDVALKTVSLLAVSCFLPHLISILWILSQSSHSFCEVHVHIKCMYNTKKVLYQTLICRDRSFEFHFILYFSPLTLLSSTLFYHHYYK